MVYVMLSGNWPFPGSASGNQNALAKSIAHGEYVWNPNHWKGVSPMGVEFVKKLLVRSPSARLTATEALQHPWVNSQMSPNGRSGSEKSQLEAVTVDALCNFGRQNQLRRACTRAMAWSLPSEEQHEMRKAFLDIDVAGTGVIHMDDFKKVILKHYKIEDKAVQDAFDAIDSSHHNAIHYSDFLAAVMSARVDLHENLIEETFRRFDTHGTGQIGMDDLQTLLGDGVNEQDVHGLIRQISSVGDDYNITHDDFVRYMKQGNATAVADCPVHATSHRIIDAAMLHSNDQSMRTLLKRGATRLHSKSEAVLDTAMHSSCITGCMSWMHGRVSSE